MTQQSMQPAQLPSVTACLIVKNEAHCLARCLESLAGVVHEIIVVDTGSTDTTLEVARRFTSQVFTIPWNHHFAEARNSALSHATGDWILVIDADEVLSPETAKLIPDYLTRPEYKRGPVVLNFRVCSDHQEDLYTRGLFPNREGIHFAGRVHEVPVLAGGPLPSYHCPDLVLWHDSPGTQDRTKLHYYHKLLQQSLQEETAPARINHLQKHLGLSHLALQQWSEAWTELSECYQGMQVLGIQPHDGFYGEVIRGLVQAGRPLNHPETGHYAIELLTYYPLEPLAQAWASQTRWRKSLLVVTLCALAACSPASTIPVTNRPPSSRQDPIFLLEDGSTSRGPHKTLIRQSPSDSRTGGFSIKAYFCPSQNSVVNACYASGGHPVVGAQGHDQNGNSCYQFSHCSGGCGQSCGGSSGGSGGSSGDGDRVCKTSTSSTGEATQSCFTCPTGESIIFEGGKPVACSSRVLDSTRSAPFGIQRVYSQEVFKNSCGEGF